jgi:acyl-[acyl-carrier-protein]-phospholipid O-acyltransferase/long-chain-fatty-acid--[acyl-carrier-protein] ligase
MAVKAIDDAPASPRTLMTSRRFLPLFATQFLGALNDNLFKNAMVILIVFRLAPQAGLDGAILANLAAGVFILPFFVFSAPAGRLADRLEKSRLIALIKACEIGFMLLGGLGLWRGDLALLFGVLFLMGLHSTFFGPLKYSILPVHLRAHELIAGNALVEAGTFLAILLGTIAGGLLVLADDGRLLVSAGLVAVAAVGYGASRFIPTAPPSAPGLALDPNIARDGWRLVREVAARRALFVPILGLSLFWMVGATYLSQLPALTRDVIGADQRVVTLFLTAFSVGIAAGSLLCSRLLSGEVTLRLVPWAGLGIALFTIDLYFACRALPPPQPALMGLARFLATPADWRVLGDLLLVAISGGVYTVPLYAALQIRARDDDRSRVIASSNILSALFMVVGALVTVALLAAGLDVPGVLLVLGLANLAAALGTLWSMRRNDKPVRLG